MNENKKILHASSVKRGVVESTIRKAKNHIDGGFDSLKTAQEILNKAKEQMRPGWDEGLFHMTDGRMTREDTDFCWQIYNEAKELINSRRKELFSNNYHRIKEDLYPISDMAVYGDPYEALKRIKETRNKVYSNPMSSEGRESILSALNNWGEKAHERIVEKKKVNEQKQKEWEQRKNEREKKQREWEFKNIERAKKQKEWEEKKRVQEIKQKEWEQRKADRERKQREWEERQRERERKQREWEARKLDRERKQREWEERQRERERNQREWEERKAERERERERKQQEWEDRKRNRGSGGRRNRSSGGCFITTATCETLGKSDNCFELKSIRNYRDNWLSKQKGGKKIISNYYVVAPLIVSKINSLKNRENIYKFIWDEYLDVFFKLIIIDKNTQAKEIYLKMVSELIVTFLDDKQRTANSTYPKGGLSSSNEH